MATYFTDHELACRCCGVNGTTQELQDALDALRVAAGVPITVNSGYRCPKRNSKVGGVPDSTHVAGQAADIVIHGMTPAQMEQTALRMPVIRGLGRDDQEGYIHIDVRPGTVRARWCYRDGKWCAWFPPVDKVEKPAS